MEARTLIKGACRTEGATFSMLWHPPLKGKPLCGAAHPPPLSGLMIISCTEGQSVTRKHSRKTLGTSITPQLIQSLPLGHVVQASALQRRRRVRIDHGSQAGRPI